MSEWMWLNVALAEVCGSTVEKGGVAGAEFSTDVTFSQWFCFLINACSSLRSLQNTGEFGRFWCTKWCFRLFRPYLFQRVHSANSVRFPLSRKCSPRVPPEPLRVPQFGNRGSRWNLLSVHHCIRLKPLFLLSQELWNMNCRSYLHVIDNVYLWETWWLLSYRSHFNVLTTQKDMT